MIYLRKLKSSLPLPLQREVHRLRHPAAHTSRFTNVYHCTIQKAASQWVQAILADERTFHYSNLFHALGEDAQAKTIVSHDRKIKAPFPIRTIVSPLYITYESYRSIPTNGPSRAIYVMRDPRDLIVSNYFSLRYSHVPIGAILSTREHLEKLDESAGLHQMIEWYQSLGGFAGMLSWAQAAARDPDILVIQFETLTGMHSKDEWARIFSFFDIHMPPEVLQAVLEDHSFEAKAGRKQGQEDKSSHYRKGIAGDWKNHFNEQILPYFKEVTGDLVVRLKYESDNHWGL
jgi:hypothetical protein